MIVPWRAALAAASICLVGSAQAQERTATARGTAGETAAETAEGSFHDGAAPPAAEESSAIDLSAVYTAEILGNAQGGANRGARYLDNLDVTLTVDAERAFGWRGATLFAYGLYNNGESFSDDLVGAAQGVSNIETGVRAARLYEAWIEQRFALDRASVKFGLYDLNSEFDVIEAAALFLNPSHGIGPDFSQSGRNGPSIFPITSLGLRGDYKPAENWFVRAAVLDAVPGDPERPERTTVQLGDGALAVLELNYLDERTKAAVGYWRYTGRFETFRTTPSEGEPEEAGGNGGVYAFLERRLTREAGDHAQGLAGWVRLGFADERLNPIGNYLGGGLSYTGPFEHRDADQIGLAVGVAEFGRPFRRSSALSGDPVERREMIIEATYRAPLTSRLTLQPDIQYVINPGGRSDTANALILGVRGEIGF